MTIDNQKQAKALMKKMEAQLPIPVRATDELVSAMKPHDLKLKRGQELSIKNLFYAGNMGGITCDVTPSGAKSVVLCSLTQVEIDPDHPLGEEIQAYQRVRKRGISQGSRRAGSAFFGSRKKGRKGRR